ncbi:hypothetical protein SeMB42_g03734 [Synchytrium endobioticum]|uniref:DNA repair protein RAD50 n=1 Tax=Synchytrium endobioticum TaxID=286115 RepID=A0A507CVZ8_9FUNG|nr:hypothetical protein SeLEV6574_g05121 [Synchytrium endobioticum]TPX46346.1 hypothetical protein SeMB42_g03734 [Synchytrium endobioticum]
MSSIDRLAIRGIRSFSPDEVNIIKFYSPLTVIVGANGTGKTTIIECLKFATTGEFPPGSKGGAFIYDPKLTGLSELKAQVRLKFLSVNGTETQVSRTVQVTQKKGKIEQKTLDTLLRVKDPNTGKTKDLSGRCGDVNAEIPMLLGVTPAILDNVIFCHQEESNWPLSEPSVLKKKFDDIFASARYTKAMEAVKNNRKDLAAEIKTEEETLKFLKADKERADKMMKNLEETDREIGLAERKLSVIEEGNLKEVLEQLRELRQEQAELEGVREEINQVKKQRDYAAQQTVRLMSDLKDEIYEEPDEQLKALLQQHVDSLTFSEQDRTDLIIKQQKSLDSIKQFQDEINALSITQGSLKAQQKANESRVQDRDQLISELSRKHGFRGFQTPLMHQDAPRFVNKMNAELRDRKQLLETLIATARAEEQQMTAELQKVQTELSTEEHGKQSKRSLVMDHTNKMAQLQTQIRNSSSRDRDVEILHQRLEQQERQYAVAKAAFDAYCADAKLRELNEQVAELEKEMNNVNIKLASMNQISEDRARASSKGDELQRKEVERNQLRINVESEIECLDPSETTREKFDIPQLAQTVQAICRAKENAFRDTRESAERAKAGLSKAEYVYESTKASVDSKTADLNAKRSAVRRVCGDDDFEDLWQQVEEDYQTAQANAKSLEFAADLWKKLASDSHGGEICPVCERECNSQEGAKLLTKLSKRGKVSRPEEVQELELRRSELLAVQAAASLAKILEKEVGELKKQTKTLENSRRIQQEVTGDAIMESQVANAQWEAAKTLRQKIDELMKIQNEINILKTEVSSLQDALGKSGMDTGAVDFASELGKLQAELNKARQERDRVSVENQVKQEALRKFEMQVQTTRREFESSVQKAEHRRELEQMLHVQSRQVEQLNHEIEAADRRVAELRPQLQALESGVYTARQAQAEREASERRAVDSLQASANKFQMLVSDLTKYEQENIDEQLLTNTQALEDKQSRLARLQEDSKSIEERRKKMDNDADQVKLKEYTVNANLQLRVFQRDQIEYDRKISELQVKQGKYDGQRLESAIRDVEGQQDELTQEKMELRDRLIELRRDKRNYEKDLTGDYVNAHQRYWEAEVSVKNKKVHLADAETLQKGIDSAIIKFHSRKMQEINKIISELWNKTYKGKDISTIKILAEHDASKARGSYTYRVVMEKGDHPIDMRGRCSAGQKVLTSIIIRLALAESFGARCGLLALDEPTTNLDQANIKGLVEALSEIIESRQAQSNFQLIVITHDETFVEKLGQHFSEYYYQIFKEEGGASQIVRHAFAGEE